MKHVFWVILSLLVITQSAYAIEIKSINCEALNLPLSSNPIAPINNEIDEQEYLSLFEYNPISSVKVIDKKRKEKDLYTREVIDIKSPLKGETKDTTFQGILYKTEFPGRGGKPLILIAPTIKGVTIIEHRLAKKLAAKGYNSLIFAVPRDKKIHTKPATELNKQVQYFVTGIQLWLDYLQDKPFINKDRIGIFATSDGANRTSVILGYEKRIKAAVLYVAGGNYPTMMTNSDQRIVRKYRKYKMKDMGLSKQGFLSLMKNTLTYDPTYLAQYRDPKDLYMVIALKDDSVPTVNQIELWRAFGEPQSHCRNLDHIKGALTSLLEHEKIESFFRSRFNSL